jgi:hypothetical protein
MAKTGIMSLEPKRETKAQQFTGEDKTATQPEVKPKVNHHELFMYPLRPEPNPALAPFFDKLEEIRSRIEEIAPTSHTNPKDK